MEVCFERVGVEFEAGGAGAVVAVMGGEGGQGE